MVSNIENYIRLLTYIWDPTDMTTQVQSGFVSNLNEGIISIPQNSRISDSPSDYHIQDTRVRR